MVTTPPASGSQPTAAATSRTTRPGVARMIELAPLLLVVVAEAAWIAVLGGLLQEYTLHRTVLGIPILAAFVAAGVLAARVVGARLGERWPPVALVIAVIGAVVGWALSEEARGAAVAGPGAGLAAHPGGLVAGLAVIRGYAHAKLPLAEGTVARLFSVGIPGLAFVAIAGGIVGEPFRSAFLGEALAAAIVFVASAALALALVRLDEVGQDGSFDWRRNPPWFLLAVLALVAAIVVSIPLAAVAGTVISVLVSVALGPMLVVGLASGFDRTARRMILFFGLIAVVLYFLSLAPVRALIPNPDAVGANGQPIATTGEGVIFASLSGLLIVAAVVGIILLIALWMRRTSPIEPDVDETRSIDRGDDPRDPRRRRGRFRRRIEPRSAVEAYLALVDDLARHADLRREPAETPAGHAARIRTTGAGATFSLDLLAADYALVRYGGETLTEAEDRRGVARWRLLRRALIHGPRRRPGATATDTTVPQAAIDATKGTRTGLRAG
jgi:hypothetical protein